MNRLHFLVPWSQRRTADQLDERLDLCAGDRASKRSAFWIMLTLSAVIAVAGVIGDSTATVIGAMIVAPLSTPILGVGLGIVTGRGRLIAHSVVYVVGGVVLVVATGYVFAQVLPNPGSVLVSSQVVGRTSPTLMDLAAALATGFAGAIAVTRRDVGDVLPGVAIAISLVPPLGVAGVCLGSDAPALALGALVLFASNVIALIITASVVLVAAGYASSVDGVGGRRRGRAYGLLATALVVVAIPMVVNSLSSVWQSQVSAATQRWLDDGGAEDAEVRNVGFQGGVVTVDVLGPQDLPPVTELERTVDDLLPWSSELVIVRTVGGRIYAE